MKGGNVLLKRKPKKGQRKPPTGFPENVRQEVRRRSGGRCEILACDKRADHFHHRKLRRHGDHRSVNTLHVCNEHHQWIHANVEASITMGWIVPSWKDPAEVPVR